MLATSFRELAPIAACDLFSYDDKVVARWSSSGVHNAEFMGIPATGRRVMLKGIDLFHLREGKIIDLWQEIDIMGILQQISAPLPNGTHRESISRPS
jgi:predicted ester cyclase